MTYYTASFPTVKMKVNANRSQVFEIPGNQLSYSMMFMILHSVITLLSILKLNN